jgi:hypothetical protein
MRDEHDTPEPVVPANPPAEPSPQSTPFSSPAMEERDKGLDPFGVERQSD